MPNQVAARCFSLCGEEDEGGVRICREPGMLSNTFFPSILYIGGRPE